MEQKRNNSKKRQAILDMLRGTTAHPCAETIYNTLKPDIPELSLGTVYRNLQVLEQDGLVRVVCTVDGQARYDARVEPHIHCTCRVCRRVFDVECEQRGDYFSALRYEPGFVPEAFEINISGLCSVCRGK